MTASSTSSTNDANTASSQVSTASPNVNIASPQLSTVSFSDNAVYAFMVENPNGSNLLHQDLEQIHEDDLEAMDLKWQLSLLSMRAKRYYQRTGKKIFINANDTAGYDKSKVECFNYHKMGYFSRECRAPRSKEGRFRNQENTRKQGNNEDTSSKAMLDVDGVGFDWSDMAEEQVQTNMALMAFSDSENEVLFSEEVAVLKREVACKDYEINVLKSEFKKVKQEKEGIEFKIEKFDKASKDLDQLLGKPRIKGVYYNYTTNMTRSNAQRNMVPRAVLMKTNLKTFKTARTVNTAHPKSTYFSAKSILRFSKAAQSTERRPFQSKTALSNKRFIHKVNTAKAQVVNTARPQAVNIVRPNTVKTARPYCAVVNVVRVHQENAGKPQQDDIGFLDSGCKRHMTGNIAYLSGFKEFDGGYVTFGGGAHGGRISGKGTLKTDSLDFEDATSDESMLWHRRLGHINFKNINKLVKDNLVRGLPTKHFENNQTYVAYLKRKQHRASCKSKVLNPITKPLFMLHMDLFGPTFMSSLMHNKYCLVVTDDYSRFTWVFFLATKDETSEILKNFIKEIENLVGKKVIIIRSDNGTEFKNKVMDDFCREKGIKREYSVARTPKQNGVAKRRNRTLIDAARTMLADSKLPTTFWAEAVSTACYIRSDLHLEDAGGTDCLPTATIFEELARIGKSKDAQQKEIAALKELRSKGWKGKESMNYKGRRIEDIDKDADVSLVDDTQGRLDDADMFDIDDLHGDEVNVDMPVGENQ
ncbi:putative ribonuclease H-like domain-containing protein [Tanacetum coccineum]